MFSLLFLSLPRTLSSLEIVRGFLAVRTFWNTKGVSFHIPSMSLQSSKIAASGDEVVLVVALPKKWRTFAMIFRWGRVSMPCHAFNPPSSKRDLQKIICHFTLSSMVWMKLNLLSTSSMNWLSEDSIAGIWHTVNTLVTYHLYSKLLYTLIYQYILQILSVFVTRIWQ